MKHVNYDSCLLSILLEPSYIVMILSLCMAITTRKPLYNYIIVATPLKRISMPVHKYAICTILITYQSVTVLDTLTKLDTI
jgi:hypothetical protein